MDGILKPAALNVRWTTKEIFNLAGVVKVGYIDTKILDVHCTIVVNILVLDSTFYIFLGRLRHSLLMSCLKLLFYFRDPGLDS